MSDSAHYQANLAGEKVAISDGAARVGYYKMRRHKNDKWHPVCIWRHEGELVCRVGADMADDVNAVWLYCSDNPVSKADALFAFENAGRWPGDAPAPIGSNMPPSDDPFDEISRKLEAEAERVDAWVAEKHEGATAANMAANWLVDLRKLEKETVAAFDTEKAPVLAESKRIDTKWRGVKNMAASIKKKMDDCCQAIGRKEKARLQAIADAKAKEEAERRRQEWEAEQAKIAALAQEHNIPAEPEPAPEIVVVAEPVKVAFGGAQGSRIGLRKVPPRAVVEDWAKAAGYFAGNSKVKELVQRLADHAARDGHQVPGVKMIPGE